METCCYTGCEEAASTFDFCGDLACTHHAFLSWGGIPWAQLTLTDGERDIHADSREGIALLRAYRATGAMFGGWPVSRWCHAEAVRFGYDLASLGPEAAQIDWRGFPD